MTPDAPRSAIPKVIGILMIIFGSLGLIGGLLGLLSGSSVAGMGDLDAAFGRFMTFTKVSNLFGLVISILELVAGMRLVTYRSAGPPLAIAYAVTNIATTVISGLLLFAWIKPALERSTGSLMGAGEAMIGMGLILGLVISVAWPIIVLALVTRPSARAACVRTF